MNDRTFAALVPELICRDWTVSVQFYTERLGFKILYTREESGFAYLERGPVQIMLEQLSDNWITGTLAPPFGRGINFQITVDDLTPILEALGDWPLYRAEEEAWYRDGDLEHGHREFLVQDPDGYLLRFCVELGTRPTTKA